MHGGLDAFNYASGSDGDFNSFFLVRRKKNCGMAADINGGSIYIDAKPAILD